MEISGEVVDGYADDELARLSREVDLLICGSRGQGQIGSVTLGNGSTGVMRKARCPVLVVPRGARDGFAALRAPAAEAASPSLGVLHCPLRTEPSVSRARRLAGFPQRRCARLRTGSGGSCGWTGAARERVCVSTRPQMTRG